ncbi:Embryo-specific protein ATS3A [Camellia lanceoleosa]|uniref:Embryo-specific protein ATS3A n=1 Tax=Camellia lanceoleosa TaxID=1840588 RepID=A0ACC0FD06_9ERIC|nr:Embryo-specific protein ATS3A [Camellia lanceoleosa]
MSNAVCSVLVLFSLIFVSAQASRSLLTKPQPLPSFRIINTTTTHPLLAFSKVNSTTITATSQPLPPLKTKTATSQKENGACYYTVRFTTSCSSPSYTRDQISLDFGDAYGNEVYVPRIDDPSSGTFEACSVDTFDISGPCMYDTCYLYVYRSGYDGWKLNTVEVYGYNSITFYYNTFIPRDVWYGFDYCNGLSAST